MTNDKFFVIAKGMTKPRIDAIVEALTEAEICAALGVSSFSVKNAKSAGSFPASWFRVISEMCAIHKIECPIDLFNMRQAAKQEATQ